MGLYPDLLPTDYRKQLQYPNPLPGLSGAELEKAHLALIDYLTQVSAISVLRAGLFRYSVFVWVALCRKQYAYSSSVRLALIGCLHGWKFYGSSSWESGEIGRCEVLYRYVRDMWLSWGLGKTYLWTRSKCESSILVSVAFQKGLGLFIFSSFFFFNDFYGGHSVQEMGQKHEFISGTGGSGYNSFLSFSCNWTLTCSVAVLTRQRKLVF